jgi:hypothetical protein
MGSMAAACTLRQAELDVQVYEQARAFGPVGAGIQMLPNSMKVLRGIGIEAMLRERAFAPYSHLNRVGDTGEIKRELPMPEADAVISRLEAASRKAGAVMPSAPAMTPPAQVPVPPRARGKWSELLSPAYRGRTLIVWVLWAAAFLIANSLNNWMPTLYTTVYHLDLPHALRAASMTNVAQVLLVLVCAMVIDRTGRKYWMMGAFGGGAVLLSVLAFGARRTSPGSSSSAR